MQWKLFFALGAYPPGKYRFIRRASLTIVYSLTASVSTALARGITVLPGGNADTVVPLTLLGEGDEQASDDQINNINAIRERAAVPKLREWWA